MTAPVLAVAGIAFDDAGRVLLAKRGRGAAIGSWSVPGGRVEIGETVDAALRRELLEETGLDVEVGELVCVFEHIDDEHHFVILDYLVFVRGGELVAGDDADDARWFGFDELGALPLTEGLVPVLERALELAGRGS